MVHLVFTRFASLTIQHQGFEAYLKVGQIDQIPSRSLELISIMRREIQADRADLWLLSVNGDSDL